jgi:biotin carboxyl carrier protein
MPLYARHLPSSPRKCEPVAPSNAESVRSRETEMQEIRVDEALWASSILPEGTVVRWLAANGAMVTAGKPIVEIRVEDALHEITAPASGRLTIAAAANNVVEPGSLLATLSGE